MEVCSESLEKADWPGLWGSGHKTCSEAAWNKWCGGAPCASDTEGLANHILR